MEMSKNEGRRMLRSLELKAYRSAVDALRAQGPLTKSKQEVLKSLSAALNVGEERSLSEIRRAVNDEILTLVAQSINGGNTEHAWRTESMRRVPLAPMVAPETVFTPFVDNISDIVSRYNALLDNRPPSPPNFLEICRGNTEKNIERIQTSKVLEPLLANIKFDDEAIKEELEKIKYYNRFSHPEEYLSQIFLNSHKSTETPEQPSASEEVFEMFPLSPESPIVPSRKTVTNKAARLSAPISIEQSMMNTSSVKPAEKQINSNARSRKSVSKSEPNVPTVRRAKLNAKRWNAKTQTLESPSVESRPTDIVAKSNARERSVIKEKSEVSKKVSGSILRHQATHEDGDTVERTECSTQRGRKTVRWFWGRKPRARGKQDDSKKFTNSVTENQVPDNSSLVSNESRNVSVKLERVDRSSDKSKAHLTKKNMKQKQNTEVSKKIVCETKSNELNETLVGVRFTHSPKLVDLTRIIEDRLNTSSSDSTSKQRNKKDVKFANEDMSMFERKLSTPNSSLDVNEKSDTTPNQDSTPSTSNAILTSRRKHRKQVSANSEMAVEDSPLFEWRPNISNESLDNQRLGTCEEPQSSDNAVVTKISQDDLHSFVWNNSRINVCEETALPSSQMLDDSIQLKDDLEPTSRRINILRKRVSLVTPKVEESSAKSCTTLSNESSIENPATNNVPSKSGSATTSVTQTEKTDGDAQNNSFDVCSSKPQDNNRRIKILPPGSGDVVNKLSLFSNVRVRNRTARKSFPQDLLNSRSEGKSIVLKTPLSNCWKSLTKTKKPQPESECCEVIEIDDDLESNTMTPLVSKRRKSPIEIVSNAKKQKISKPFEVVSEMKDTPAKASEKVVSSEESDLVEIVSVTKLDNGPSEELFLEEEIMGFSDGDSSWSSACSVEECLESDDDASNASLNNNQGNAMDSGITQENPVAFDESVNEPKCKKSEDTDVNIKEVELVELEVPNVEEQDEVDSNQNLYDMLLEINEDWKDIELVYDQQTNEVNEKTTKSPSEPVDVRSQTNENHSELDDAQSLDPEWQPKIMEVSSVAIESTAQTSSSCCILPKKSSEAVPKKVINPSRVPVSKKNVKYVVISAKDILDMEKKQFPSGKKGSTDLPPVSKRVYDLYKTDKSLFKDWRPPSQTLKTSKLQMSRKKTTVDEASLIEITSDNGADSTKSGKPKEKSGRMSR